MNLSLSVKFNLAFLAVFAAGFAATGIVADRKSFEATPVFFARAYCPICRTEHEWFAREAWVCEGEPRRRQGALS